MEEESEGQEIAEREGKTSGKIKRTESAENRPSMVSQTLVKRTREIPAFLRAS